MDETNKTSVTDVQSQCFSPQKMFQRSSYRNTDWGFDIPSKAIHDQPLSTDFQSSPPVLILLNEGLHPGSMKNDELTIVNQQRKKHDLMGSI